MQDILVILAHSLIKCDWMIIYLYGYCIKIEFCMIIQELLIY